MRTYVFHLVVVTIAFLCGVQTSWAGKFAPVWGKDLTAAQQRQVKQLTARYRAAYRDADERKKIVREGIGMGEAGVMALWMTINPDLYQQLKPYSRDFQQEAAKQSRGRIGSTDMREISLLRQVVLAARTTVPTQTELQTRVRPALCRLDAIFVPSRESVLAASKRLQAARERLRYQGELWEMCTMYFYQRISPGPDKPSVPPTFETYFAGRGRVGTWLMPADE